MTNRPVHDPATLAYRRRIRTTTNFHLADATIKDVSVLRMIENSDENGVLTRYPESASKKAGVLIQYWEAVRQVFPEAWALPPRKSRLTHGAGIISMGYLMDHIAFRLQHESRNLATHELRRELERMAGQLRWTSGVWEFAKSTVLEWNQIQNTSRDIDRLTNHLIRLYQQLRLPGHP